MIYKFPYIRMEFIMKKWLIVLCVIACVLMSCDNSTSGSTPNPNPVLVCLGNSLTAGYGATISGEDDKTKSYPAFLQEKLSIQVVNAGVTGDTTAGALARLKKDVLSHNPQIVIIELGANDVSHFVPLTETKENLQNIISMIDNGKRKIYLAKFYTEEVARAMLTTYNIGNYDTQTAFIKQYDDIFDGLVASYNVQLIDTIWDEVWDLHMSDLAHPNAEGYEIMANNYFSVMEPYLRENGFLK